MPLGAAAVVQDAKAAGQVVSPVAVRQNRVGRLRHVHRDIMRRQLCGPRGGPPHTTACPLHRFPCDEEVQLRDPLEGRANCCPRRRFLLEGADKLHMLRGQVRLATAAVAANLELEGVAGDGKLS